jgi:hypothetical protein
MTLTEAGKELNLSRQAIRYRMNSLAIYCNDITDKEFNQIKAFKPNISCRRITHIKTESLVWEYYTKSKYNEIPRIAKELALNIGYVGNVISKIQKRKYILLPSKIND